MVRRKIFEPKRDGITEGWRKMHNGEVPNLYYAANIIRLGNQGDDVRSTCCTWEDEKFIIKLRSEILIGTDYVGGLGVDWKINLKWNFEK
jgi:hypothetical protein